MIQKLNSANEQTWLLIGRVAEQMGDLEHALSAYENALRHNPMSLSGLTQVAGIARIKENYPSLQEATVKFGALLAIVILCKMTSKAYAAYQQALYLLPNPKEDPKLWYGIGILYDRYGSLDHAEEAFSSVLAMDKDFDKANEILFRLGIIYKQQGKYEDSLACFDRILRNPPSPLAHADIWFQIGHVYEQQKDHVQAKDAYERVVADNLFMQRFFNSSVGFTTKMALASRTKSLRFNTLPRVSKQVKLVSSRSSLYGRPKVQQAYEAYQQAVYRDGRNPTFWCSIGVLYFQINQFQVWFDLGSLYESCNNQISDAIDAYARASELDPGNAVISNRLQLLKTAQATGGQLPAAPGPQDVHPTAYASAVRSSFRAESRNAPNEISLPPPSQSSASRSSPGPFRGGPPPPVNIDESRHASLHTPLAPMEIDGPIAQGRDFLPSRDNGSRPGSLLLHHPNPSPADDVRARGPHGDYFPRHRAPSSRSSSPPPLPSVRTRSSPPPPPYSSFAPSTRAVGGPAQPLPTRSPRTYASQPPGRSEHEIPWDRRSGDHWEPGPDRRSGRHNNDYPQQSSFYPRVHLIVPTVLPNNLLDRLVLLPDTGTVSEMASLIVLSWYRELSTTWA
ncbi:hypothetical protein C8R42DRAFT_730079 [Lentinula raphanica]|nr:hypothetical protein C8R42DRAFT_730079 [Lentinula raphanica]